MGFLYNISKYLHSLIKYKKYNKCENNIPITVPYKNNTIIIKIIFYIKLYNFLYFSYKNKIILLY